MSQAENYQEREAGVCPIESLLKTSVSTLFFTQDHVYKVWHHQHPLITGLEYLPTRYGYLEGEMEKGKKVGSGAVYDNVIPVYFEREEKNRIVAIRELSLEDVCKKGVTFAWDFALKMKRFPEEGKMSELLKADMLEENDVVRAVEKIIQYHQLLPVSEEANARATAKHFDENVRKPDFQIIRKAEFAPRPFIDDLEHNEAYFLDKMASAFQQRINDGWIKDGHGDTKMTNICKDIKGMLGISGEVYILDAIAFKLDWSGNDLLSEIAYFLLLFDFYEPEFFTKWLDIVEDKYYQLTLKTITDNPLFWFYMNYRAWVEAKVAGLEERNDDARSFLSMANEYLTKAFELANLEWQTTDKS